VREAEVRQRPGPNGTGFARYTELSPAASVWCHRRALCSGVVRPSQMLKLLVPGFTLFSLLVAATAAGQTPRGGGATIIGIVHSEAGEPVSIASVALRRSTGTTVVAESITAASGAFRIEGVAPGSYVVEVSHIGYRTATRSDVTITASTERFDMGIIELEPSAIALEGIDVRAAPAPIAILPDRNVYSTRDMPAAVGGTATDVLRSVPELEVSMEGSVTTRGATPSIHINGRPAPMQGEALDRYLQQLPAERIDRIEVIPNPSARYEADGQGGIVNIVMKRGTNLGLSGSIAANAGTGNQQGASGNMSYQAGRLTLFGSVSASVFGNDHESSDLRENLTTQPTTFIQQDSRDHDSGDFGSVDLSAEVKVGSHGALWSDVGVGRNASDTEVHTAYTHLDHLRIPTQRYDRVNDRDLRGLFGSSSMGYVHVAEAGRREWSVQLRRTFNGRDDLNESARYWLSPDGAPLDLAPELTFAGQGQDHDGFSVEANVMRGWGESGRVEAGYRGSWRNSRNHFRMESEPTSDPAAAAESLGDFRHRERIHAVFLTANHEIGRFRVQTGLRGEQADTRSALPILGETHDTGYWNLFPSINVSTAVGVGGQLRLSYSRRVDRPRVGILDPVTPLLDPLNRQVGNPYLMPRYTHSITLTGSRTGRLGSLQLSPFYRRTVNSWDQVRTVDEEGVSTVTWQNLATTTSYGASINASVIQFGPVGGFVSVRGSREVRDASNLRADFSGSSTRFSVVSTANVRATSDLNVQGMLTYLPARDVPQGRISSMVFSTLGVRQQLWDGRGSVNLSVVDPFELQRFTFTTRDGTHVQTGSSTFSARRATLGISYSFGRPPQSSRRRSTPEEGQQEGQAPRIR
jgi:hypothetical protein